MVDPEARKQNVGGELHLHRLLASANALRTHEAHESHWKAADQAGDKVKATVVGSKVNFEGPKGKLVVQLPAKASRSRSKDGELHVVAPG